MCASVHFLLMIYTVLRNDSLCGRWNLTLRNVILCASHLSGNHPSQKKILTSVANSVEIDNRLLKLVGVCLTDLST